MPLFKSKKQVVPESLEYMPSMMAYQVSMRNNRIWQITTICFATASVLLAAAIISIMPLKTVEVKYVEFSHSQDSFFQVYPATMAKDQRLLLIRKALRHYVEMRHTLNGIDEKIRFRSVLAMSTTSVWNSFKQEFERTRAVFNAEHRQIEIVYDNAIGDGIHEIEFRTIDTAADGKQFMKNWRVNIAYTIDQNPIIKGSDDLINPLGIHITRYAFNIRNTKDENAKLGAF